MIILAYIGFAFGVVAFLCDVRESWRGMMAARKHRLAQARLEQELPPIDEALLDGRTPVDFDVTVDDAALRLS